MFSPAVYVDSNFSTSSLTFLFSVILIIVILVGVKCYLILVLICISQMTNESLFHVYIGHYYIFFEEMFIQLLCPIFKLVIGHVITEL